MVDWSLKKNTSMKSGCPIGMEKEMGNGGFISLSLFPGFISDIHIFVNILLIYEITFKLNCLFYSTHSNSNIQRMNFLTFCRYFFSLTSQMLNNIFCKYFLLLTHLNCDLQIYSKDQAHIID